jgi:hypothetical protein
MDYTRRGFFDGIGIRLPTICVRPGKPNKAASGFFLRHHPRAAGRAGGAAAGAARRSSTPMPARARRWVSSIHGAEIDGARVGPRRNITMPGVAVTVGEQIEALRRIAGEDVVKLIREVPDETIWAIVKNWPTRFESKRARANSASRPSRISTRSSRRISRTNWAARSPERAGTPWPVRPIVTFPDPRLRSGSGACRPLFDDAWASLADDLLRHDAGSARHGHHWPAYRRL